MLSSIPGNLYKALSQSRVSYLSLFVSQIQNELSRISQYSGRVKISKLRIALKIYIMSILKELKSINIRLDKYVFKESLF